MMCRDIGQRLGPMAPGDPDIWKIAAVLVRRYGCKASLYADARGRKALREGDRVTWQIWQWIEGAAEELLKPEPDAGERRH